MSQATVDGPQGQNISEAETFWQSQLAGFHAPTPLPTDSTADACPTSKSWRHMESSRLSAINTNAICSFTQTNRLSLETLVLGAWALLLSRYNGIEDVLFGVPSAHREGTAENKREIADCLSNTLALQVHVSAEKAVLPWLQDLHSRCGTVQAHGLVSLKQLRDWSAIPAGTPLFESVAGFEESDFDTKAQLLGLHKYGHDFRFYEPHGAPLSVMVYGGERLNLTITYNPRRVSEATVSRMLGHIETILNGFAACPDQRLCDSADTYGR